MKIFRHIYVKDINEIDFKNLGNHWSTFEFFTYNPFSESNELRGKNEDDYIKIWIEAEIDSTKINKNNEELKDYCNNEHEIITSFNTDIEIIACTEDDIIFEGIANTGDRYQEIAY